MTREGLNNGDEKVLLDASLSLEGLDPNKLHFVKHLLDAGKLDEIPAPSKSQPSQGKFPLLCRIRGWYAQGQCEIVLNDGWLSTTQERFNGEIELTQPDQESSSACFKGAIHDTFGSASVEGVWERNKTGEVVAFDKRYDRSYAYGGRSLSKSILYRLVRTDGDDWKGVYIFVPSTTLPPLDAAREMLGRAQREVNEIAKDIFRGGSAACQLIPFSKNH